MLRGGNALSGHSGSLVWRLFLPWVESLKTEPFFGLNQTPGLFVHLNHAAVLVRGVLQIIMNGQSGWGSLHITSHMAVHSLIHKKMQKQTLVFEEDVKHTKPETYTQTHTDLNHLI